jgi:hypothetical protein
MNKSDAINELATALHLAQGKIKHAIKDSSNPFFKSRYADLSSVWDAIRDAFQSHGLAVTQIPDMDGDKPVLVTVLMHKSGQWISGTYPINPSKNDPQGIGSAITYARRYALQAVAGVCPDDDDGEAAHGRIAKVDSTTGEVKKAQPKWTDDQRTEIGKWFNAIIQGNKDGERLVNDFRAKYKYTDPVEVIRLCKEWCHDDLGIEL